MTLSPSIALAIALSLALPGSSDAAYVATKKYAPADFKGKVYGNGGAVSFVREVTGAPDPSKWKKGAPVRDNKDIKNGTAIATFDKDGKFLGHAAVYVGQTDVSFTVVEQHKGSGAGYRVVRYKGPELRPAVYKPANDGNVYYVIE